jgi:acetolactate synthase-1/2/3 large subunit
MIKLSDYVIESIAKQGVKHVFLLPGGGAMHLNDSLGKCPDIEFVCNLHEQASAIAAEAYAKVTNNLGVAIVTSGPGGTNTVTGLAGAWLDSTPCLFISGQVKRADLMGDLAVRQLGVQEVDIVSIVQSITKYAITITDPNTIKYHLENETSIRVNIKNSLRYSTHILKPYHGVYGYLNDGKNNYKKASFILKILYTLFVISRGCQFSLAILLFIHL